MTKKFIMYFALIIVALYLILVGLGPIRRVLQPIVPDVLRSKTTVNSVCADNNRVYIFSSDSGQVSVQVIPNNCTIEKK